MTVGTVGTIVALRTLNAIKEQARISRVGLKAARIAASASTASARAAKESAETASRALLLTERADILIAGVNISATGGVLQPDSEVSLVFKNYGRTRASRVRITSSLLVPDQIEDEQISIPSLVLGAGDVKSNCLGRMDRWMTQKTFHEVCQGIAPLRFEAAIVYRDVFDKIHHTKCSGTFMPRACNFRVDDNQETD